MSQKDKLRNTLREYYDNQKFSIDENDWERASVYIKNAKRNRTLRNAAYTIGALIIVLLLALVVFPSTENVSKQSAVTDSKQNKKPIAQSNNNKNSQTFVINEETGHPTTKNKTKPTKPAGNISSEITSDATNISTQAFIADKFKSGKVKNAVEESISTPLSNEYDIVEALSENAPDITTIEKKSKENKETENSQNEEKVETVIEENSLSPSELESTKEEVESVQEIVSTATVHTIDNFPLTKTILPEDVKPSTKAAQNDEENADENISLDDYSDSSQIALADSLAFKKSFKPFASEGLYFEVGTAWFYGWQSITTIDARGFSPLAGINYMNCIGNKFAFSFGAQYYQVRKLSSSTKTSRESYYLYGEYSNVTVITPTTLHYLTLPLRFHYYLNTSHSFGAGANLSYLLNVDANVTSYEERPGFLGNYNTIKQSGYTEGFSWYDSQIALFYRLKLNSSFAIHSETFFGLKDIKQNAFFGINNYERNLGIKLTLIYHALKRNNK